MPNHIGSPLARTQTGVPRLASSISKAAAKGLGHGDTFRARSGDGGSGSSAEMAPAAEQGARLEQRRAGRFAKAGEAVFADPHQSQPWLHLCAPHHP